MGADVAGAKAAWIAAGTVGTVEDIRCEKRGLVEVGGVVL